MHSGEMLFGGILAIGSITGLAGMIHFTWFAIKVKPKLIERARSRGVELVAQIYALHKLTPDAPPRRHLLRIRRQLVMRGGLDAAFSHGISFAADAANDAVHLYTAPYGKGLSVLSFWASMATITALAGTVSGCIAIFSAMGHDKTDLFSVIGGVGVCLRMTCGGMVVALISNAAARTARHALADLQTNVRLAVLALHDAVVDSWPKQQPIRPIVSPLLKPPRKLQVEASHGGNHQNLEPTL